MKIATVLELLESFAELTYLTTFNEQLHANELLSAEAGAPLFLLLKAAGLVAAAVHTLGIADLPFNLIVM